MNQDHPYDTLWSRHWGEMQRIGPVHRHLTRQICDLASHLGPATILDIGCGAGDNLAALARVGSFSLAGTDLSHHALERAQTRVPAVVLHQLDVRYASLDQRFDLVISNQVLEHIDDDIAAIRNMASMTGKHLYVTTMQGRMRSSEVGIGHVRNYSALELRRKLEIAGLEVVRIDGWGFPFYSPLYRTAAEWLPGGPPGGDVGGFGRVVASMLYHLYRLNIPGRGDVLRALARRPD